MSVGNKKEKLKTIKAVYSYYFPEIRELIDDLVKNYPHNVFLQSIDPGLDDFEKPILNKMAKYYKDEVSGFETFDYAYATNGSSEGIYHILMQIKNNYAQLPIYVLEGEYEGYKEGALCLGLHVKEIKKDKRIIDSLPTGFWFISNPSARNGNLLDKYFIDYLCGLGHKIILDLAYLGMTRKYKFNLHHKNIFAVLTSMSKPFGLFYYRIGFTFSRKEIRSLYGNKWFKNIFSLIIADRIFSSINYRNIYKKYKKYQKEILLGIFRDTGIKLRNSNVPILAYLNQRDYEKLSSNQKKEISKYKRGDYYRFCLTPYFLEKVYDSMACEKNV